MVITMNAVPAHGQEHTDRNVGEKRDLGESITRNVYFRRIIIIPTSTGIIT